MNIEFLFYLGVLVIIFVVIWLIFIYFKKYDEISLKEHKWILIVYIAILIVSIYTWRYVFDFFFSDKFLKILQNSSSLNGLN